MKPKPHQIALAKEGIKVIKENALVYLGSEERTGKTITAILIAEAINVETILVITKKKALKGWKETLAEFYHKKPFRVINYHQVKNTQLNYDLIILDEAHNYISCFPKRTPLWNEVKKLTLGKPIIYISATPHAQGYHLLYNQLALSSWSPWAKYSTFYEWFGEYGLGKKKKIGSRYVNDYTKVADEIIEDEVKHLFVTKTRKELNFEHEPKDILHYVELTDTTKNQYNYMLKKKVIELKDTLLLLDTPMKLRTSLHMLEGGIAKNTVYSNSFDKTNVVYSYKEKIDEEYIYHVYYELNNKEKIDYIIDTWGDSKNVAIMYNYKGEMFKLKKYLKNASFFQSTSDAEGTDLSMYEHLIIYSQTFSTAQHTQRRARQANMNRKTPINVHYLLVKKAISAQVYKTVSINKTNYVDTRFEREVL